jgi:D-methionine transport system ATP-binding protein
MITLEHVSKTFSTPDGPLRAVQDVSLEIGDGDIFGIIGFSGAGKSTLLRTINLLERPDPDPAARVIVDGRDMIHLPPAELGEARRSIGFVFQHYHLLNNRTVFDNVAFPLELARTEREERLSRVRECLDIVGLSDKANAFPAKLSGGQKQRVAIARALANNPSILLADEPTGNLDSVNSGRIMEILTGIQEKRGMTLIIVTHENDIANAAPRHIRIRDGRIDS